MNSRGFTLVEMLVSVALFAIVMLMVASAYLIIIAGNRQAQAVATASNNLGFALETMTRSIRTGSAYGCGTAGTDGSPCGGSFVFTDSSGCLVTYALSGGAVVESGSGASGCLSATPAPLTNSLVSVTALKFYLLGSGTTASGDYRQPQVTISISGTVAAGAGKSVPFTIETGATMRGVDL